MAYDVAGDIRLDPRLKAILAGIPVRPAGDVDSRETLLAEANSQAARQRAELLRSFMDLCDTEDAAPSAGLRVYSEKVVSEPDGNTINLQVIRPDHDEAVACVYYIHGGGMATMSCYDGAHRGWGKIIAANGVAVVMVDFRNSVVPSSVPEVAPFPAGLNDCVSGLKWVAANARHLSIDPARVIVAGESGGGNLALATGLKLKQDGELGLIKGLYAMCPYIAGQWPTPECLPLRKTTGSCWTCITTAALSGTGSRPSPSATRWPGRPSRLRPTFRSSRPRSSVSTSAIRCAMRASISTGSCCGPGFRPGAGRSWAQCTAPRSSPLPAPR